MARFSTVTSTKALNNFKTRAKKTKRFIKQSVRKEFYGVICY